MTTYLGDVVYTGTTASWQLVNLHGDVVGTTDAVGAFTAVPTADEFGVGQVPADRLGWLGGKDRFNVGGSLGLIRMGVRLYDTRTGRFLSIDPVEGGSANDYDYAMGDPVNNYDLDGTRCWTGKNKNGSCRSISRGAGRQARKIYRHNNISVGGCLYVCANITFAHGHLYGSTGGVGLGLRGLAIGYTSKVPGKQGPWSIQSCGAFGVGGCVMTGDQAKPADAQRSR